jgi:hypothetical protein
MTDAGEQALAFLRALARLPPYTGIVFHGLASVPDLSRTRWTRGVIPTSKDARIGTENFRTPIVAAIVSRSGRDISPFSAHPSEQEVVIPPEVPLREVARTTTPDGRSVLIIEQLGQVDPDSGLPGSVSGLVTAVEDLLRRAAENSPAEITTPSKFVEPLSFADEA